MCLFLRLWSKDKDFTHGTLNIWDKCRQAGEGEVRKTKEPQRGGDPR